MERWGNRTPTYATLHSTTVLAKIQWQICRLPSDIINRT